MGKNPKPGKRRKISPARRHALARRDQAAWWLWGRNGPMWVYQCAACRGLIRTGTATAGHIRPRSDGGGTEDENLRIECAGCNGADNIRRLLGNRPSAEARALEAQTRSEGKLRARRGRPQVFANLPVYWGGRHLSFTSTNRAGRLVKEGLAQWLPPGGIRLTRPPSNHEPAPTDPIPNRCVRCGAGKGLHRLSFYPAWHPSYRGSRPSLSARPVCTLCLDVFEIAYADAITRAAAPVITAAWRARHHQATLSSTAYEAWSRKKKAEPFPPDLLSRFERMCGQPLADPTLEDLRRLSQSMRENLRDAERGAFAAVAAAVLESDLAFPDLFNRIALGDYRVTPETLPRLPLEIASPAPAWGQPLRGDRSG